MMIKQKKVIQFGIIGCSSIAKRITIPSILNAKNANLHMIGSRNVSKAKKFAERFSCEKFGTYEDVLNDDNIDAVYISLPIGLQQKEVIRAAKKGRHVICEKSATTSLESAKKMIKICKENNVRIMENFSFKYHPQYKLVKKIIAKKKHENPNTFVGRFSIPMKYSSRNFRFKRKLGGSALNDLGCYIIASSRLVFGLEPIFINCRLYTAKNNDIDISGSIFLEFPQKHIAFGTFGYQSNFQANYEIISSNSRIDLDLAYNIRGHDKAQINIHTKNKIKTIKLKPVDQTKLMIEDFCNSLIYNKNTLTYERDLLEQARIMEVARLSNIKNRWLIVKQVRV